MKRLIILALLTTLATGLYAQLTPDTIANPWVWSRTKSSQYASTNVYYYGIPYLLTNQVILGYNSVTQNLSGCGGYITAAANVTDNSSTTSVSAITITDTNNGGFTCLVTVPVPTATNPYFVNRAGMQLVITSGVVKVIYSGIIWVNMIKPF